MVVVAPVGCCVFCDANKAAVDCKPLANLPQSNFLLDLTVFVAVFVKPDTVFFPTAFLVFLSNPPTTPSFIEPPASVTAELNESFAVDAAKFTELLFLRCHLLYR